MLQRREGCHAVGGANFMRKLLFLLLAMLLLAGVEAAIACSRLDEPPSDEELFAKASAVFVGHVVRVEEAGAVSVREWLAYPPWVKVEWRTPKAVAESSPPWPALQATFRVVEVFKGQPPADGKIRAPVGNYCTGPLFWVGSDHVIFLYEGNFVRSSDESRPAFSFGRPGRDDERFGPRLPEKLRELSKNEPK